MKFPWNNKSTELSNNLISVRLQVEFHWRLDHSTMTKELKLPFMPKIDDIIWSQNDFWSVKVKSVDFDIDHQLVHVIGHPIETDYDSYHEFSQVLLARGWNLAKYVHVVPNW